LPVNIQYRNQHLNFFIPSWPVLYADNHLLAVYKPAGLLIQGDRTGDISLFDLAGQWIKRQYNKPGRVYVGMVHRLDRPVAGVVLFCRTSKAAGRISGQFRTGQPQKRYIAIVQGKIQPPDGRLVNHIERRGASGIIAHSATAKSSEARLSYRCLDFRNNSSLVEIDLETGRHHQIRLQFSHIGHPVMGDLRYGAAGPLPEKQIALFAEQLTVIHPTLGQELTFSSPLPRGWPWPDYKSADDAPPWNWCEVEKVLEF
jgi:23S rRNA pseudouridine1911/1915/1917 synthase